MADLQGKRPWSGEAGWIPRLQDPLLRRRLEQFPAVALLGPRQVGKTTLALQLAATIPSLYLDLEASADLARLSEPSLFLQRHADKLVILDEVQRLPGLFAELRGLIDAGRRQGQANGRFLLLGSASVELIRQSSESLAGRLAFLELGGLHALELGADALDKLWIRGGFPGSTLAATDGDSAEWRRQFIRTYLERDIPQLGPRVPAETLRRFWTMLAHGQGSLLNAAELGRSLGVDGKTVGRYLDLLVDLLLVRRLPPLLANVGKRLVRSPKVLVRDSGLVHTLLGLGDATAVLGDRGEAQPQPPPRQGLPSSPRRPPTRAHVRGHAISHGVSPGRWRGGDGAGGAGRCAAAGWLIAGPGAGQGSLDAEQRQVDAMRTPI